MIHAIAAVDIVQSVAVLSDDLRKSSANLPQAESSTCVRTFSPESSGPILLSSSVLLVMSAVFFARLLFAIQAERKAPERRES